MSLLIAMLPLYLFGNLHCIGMCGPLVMMIGQHRYRYFYFIGRILSFTLAAMLAGGLGSVLYLVLRHYQIPALTSFLFGSVIFALGLFQVFNWQLPGYQKIAKRFGKVNHRLSLLILNDRAWPTFLFGFFTVALPCGQTLIVFSACALSGSLLVGALNGFVFALLTTPSLWFAMHMHSFLRRIKGYHSTIIGTCAMLIGILACLRGLAEMDVIPHWVLNPQSPLHYHLIIY